MTSHAIYDGHYLKVHKHLCFGGKNDGKRFSPQTDTCTTVDKDNGWLQTRTMTQYGITSLTPECGTAKRILMLRRGHWAIENLSHRTRGVLFDEERLKSGVATDLK